MSAFSAPFNVFWYITLLIWRRLNITSTSRKHTLQSEIRGSYAELSDLDQDYTVGILYLFLVFPQLILANLISHHLIFLSLGLCGKPIIVIVLFIFPYLFMLFITYLTYIAIKKVKHSEYITFISLSIVIIYNIYLFSCLGDTMSTYISMGHDINSALAIENFLTIIKRLNDFSSNYLFMFFVYWISISEMLNLFLPKKWKMKTSSSRQRKLRHILKLVILIGLTGTGYVFSIVGSENFPVITVFMGFILLLCSPETILRVLSSQNQLSNYVIKDSIINLFLFIKIVVSEFYIAWAVSVYFIKDKSISLVSPILLASIPILLTVVAQMFFQYSYKGKLFLLNWIDIKKHNVMRHKQY